MNNRSEAASGTQDPHGPGDVPVGKLREFGVLARGNDGGCAVRTGNARCPDNGLAGLRVSAVGERLTSLGSAVRNV